LKLFDNIKHCSDCRTVKRCKNFNQRPPLWMKIPKKCRIMLVSQAPSRDASEEHILADKRNRTYMQLLKMLCISDDEFKPYIYWTHYAKCYPGPAKGGDQIPTIYCANKYLRDEYDLCEPKFVLGVGRCASIYLYSNYVDTKTPKIRIKFERIKNTPRLLNGVTFVFITHPAPTDKKTEADKKFIKEALPGLIKKTIETNEYATVARYLE